MAELQRRGCAFHVFLTDVQSQQKKQRHRRHPGLWSKANSRRLSYSAVFITTRKCRITVINMLTAPVKTDITQKKQISSPFRFRTYEMCCQHAHSTSVDRLSTFSIKVSAICLLNVDNNVLKATWNAKTPILSSMTLKRETEAPCPLPSRLLCDHCKEFLNVF